MAGLSADMEAEFQNVDNQESILLMVSCYIFLFMTWVCVGLRIWLRARFTSWDNWTMILAQVLFTITCVGSLVYRSTVNTSTLHMEIKLTTSTHTLTMAAVKISLGLFLLTIFRQSSWHRHLVYALALISTIFGLAYFIIDVATCSITAPNNHHCIPNSTSQTFSTIWSVQNPLIDLAFLLLSMLASNALQVRRTRAKLMAALPLALGTAACVASFIRLAYEAGSSADGNALTIARWSVIEAGAFIMATSLLTLVAELFTTDCRRRVSDDDENRRLGEMAIVASPSAESPSCESEKSSSRVHAVERSSLQEATDPEKGLVTSETLPVYPNRGHLDKAGLEDMTETWGFL